MAALLPPFFRRLALADGYSAGGATALWGYVTAASLLLLAVAAPFLGAVADVLGRRKKILCFFVGWGVISTGLLATVGTWHLAAWLYVAASFCFGAANIFYESLLPSLARGKELDRLSVRAYGWGYAGGGLLLVVNLVWVLHPAWFGMSGPGVAVRVSFVSAAVWWGLFSVPLLRHVPEPQAGPALGGVSGWQGVCQLVATFREISQYRELLVFLAAFWIYNDGIGTVVKMATAYGAEIGIGMTDLMGALVLTQVVGIPCALVFEWLARRGSARGAVLLALTVYGLICLGGFFMTTAAQFYLLAGAVGTVQGGAQALSRSMFAAMVPRHQSAEFFGFFAASGKVAGVVGPLVFSLVSQMAGTGRWGILSLVVFFTLGGYLLTRVDLVAGAAAARRSEKLAGY